MLISPIKLLILFVLICNKSISAAFEIMFVVCIVESTSSSYIGTLLLTPIRPVDTSKYSNCVVPEVFLKARSMPLRSKFACNNGPEILPTCDMLTPILCIYRFTCRSYVVQ